MRLLVLIFVCLLAHHNLLAQLGRSDPGLSRPGVDDLHPEIIGKTGMQKCFLPGTCSGTCGVYVFTGAGNWDEEANWQDGAIPPSTLNDCSVIIINPIGNTECVLNIPRQLLPKGSTILVKAGKRFRIPGDVQKK